MTVASIVDLSLRNRVLVLILAGVLVGLGIEGVLRLPIDAVPDISPNQVQILTTAEGLSPVEVEQFITFPVEVGVSGLPGVTEIRSVSRFGLSAVTVYFEENVDPYFARRLVLERLPEIREAVKFGTPEMGPISTGLGQIYEFEIRGEGYSPQELRTILDWDVAPRLKQVPGVVEVNSFGGELRTYEVAINADDLVKYGLSLDQVFEAIRRNNANAGGGYIVHGGEQRLIRGEGLVTDLEDLADIVVTATPGGTPVRVRDVARVHFAPMLRQGAVTRDGRGEAVTGVVMMLMGANSRVVADRVDRAVREIQRSLPPGVTIETYYDRTELVDRTIHTVRKNLEEGALLVVGVLLLMLGQLRSGLIVALAIPLSLLGAFALMVRTGLSGNLMSLGAIDFGLIVDGSVVMVENIVRHLARPAPEGPHGAAAGERVARAAREVVRPIVFGVGIIILVYVPILTLTGVEGKMFRPMAMTVIFALLTSLLLALTLMPVLASFFLTRGVREEETRLVRWFHRLYEPALDRAMGRPGLTVLAAAVLFAGSLLVAARLGTEFIPQLDEGAVAVQALRLPAASLEKGIEDATRIERILLSKFPNEVETVVSRTGRAEIATDPTGPEHTDIYVQLKPKAQWRPAFKPAWLRKLAGVPFLGSLPVADKAALVEAMEEELEKALPGVKFSFTQPIQLRMQELIAGVRSDIAIKIFGEDLEELKRLGDRVARVVAGIPGAADVAAEQVSGTQYLRIRVDREAVARYGIHVGEVLEAVETLGGKVLGDVVVGRKRFFIQARLDEETRADVDRIGNLAVADPWGRLIPLKELATISVEPGPAQISRENVGRRLAVEANVRGRDLGSFVAEAQRAVEEQVDLPPGYWIEWGGQFENLQRASRRLAIVVPTVLFFIFVMLYASFNAIRPALVIFLNVPMAATGGVLALAARGMPFSISAAVGFIALFGVAVLNGLVLVSYILQLQEEGLSPREAARVAAKLRIRPVLTTALVASLGFVPMAVATGAGAEVQRPLATVVIGGLVTSTFLTLFVVPAIYPWVATQRLPLMVPRRAGQFFRGSPPGA